jgi:hypothetical protein
VPEAELKIDSRTPAPAPRVCGSRCTPGLSVVGARTGRVRCQSW